MFRCELLVWPSYGSVRSGLIGLPPMFRRHTFPVAKCPNKGISIFIAKQVSRLREFQNGVAEVIPGHLVPCLVKNTLIAGAQFLQPSLERSRAHPEILRNVIDAWAVTGELLLDGSTDKLQKAVLLPGSLLQLQIELGSEHVEQFRVPGHKRERGIRAAEYERIASHAAHDRASKVTLQGLDMGVRLHKLHAQGSKFFPVPCLAMVSTQAKQCSMRRAGSTSTASVQRKRMLHSPSMCSCRISSGAQSFL